MKKRTTTHCDFYSQPSTWLRIDSNDQGEILEARLAVPSSNEGLASISVLTRGNLKDLKAIFAEVEIPEETSVKED